uniref:Small integral membrane protein 19 n=1 Tax=Podarcis muralis TaxID=64176 RepID=A0A670K032_PODMU
NVDSYGGAAAAAAAAAPMDYSVHEAWNEATNVYLLAVLASLALLVYARRNKRKIMRIFTLPPAVEVPPEPNFYDSVKKIRLRQQLEMYSIGRYTLYRKVLSTFLSTIQSVELKT